MDIAYRVLADHGRCLTFALAEGLTPSNEGRGYVLRRICRRALRFGKEVLRGELDGKFLSSICDSVVDEFGEDFPEVKENRERVLTLVEEEELSFKTLLSRGMKYFEETIVPKNSVSGKDAYFMYDTLGFPLDLTALMAKDRGLAIDELGFDKEMEKQRDRSRKAGKKKEGSAVEGNFVLEASETSYLQDVLGLSFTDDTDKYGQFDVDTFGSVKAIFDGKGNFLDEVEVDFDVGLDDGEVSNATQRNATQRVLKQFHLK